MGLCSVTPGNCLNWVAIVDSGFSKFAEGWATSGVVTLQSGLRFSILDSAAGTLFGPATSFTTGNLVAGKTLKDALRNGNVSTRVNEFFNANVFAPAPFIP